MKIRDDVVSAHACCSAHALSRRSFMIRSSALAGSAVALSAARPSATPIDSTALDPASFLQPLKVKPVLVYEISERRPATSWRPWGGLHTEQDAAAEQRRIEGELSRMKSAAEFPLEILPLEPVRNPQQAAAIAGGPQDLTLMYAASGSGKTLETLASPARWNLIFVRHRSGPVYLWYEIAHPRFLRKTVDEYGQPGMGVEDVVVDSHEDVLWRLRALYGLKNTLGKKIVAVGGASGWGAGGRQAPDISRATWKFQMVDVPYPALGERLKAARADTALVRRTSAEAEEYLQRPGVTLETSKPFFVNAFLLRAVLRDLLAEARTDAITINHCMGTIMPMAETTACLPLSLLNDQGFLAFCESDFVVIPSGVLLHYISGKPVFFNDPTYPHHGLVTLAHCTAPTKLDGRNAEPVRILTHFESDYGAAPKVEMKKGQVVTNIVPDFACKKWVGFEGAILDSPFLDICRSQVDVEIRGDGELLLREMRGFHWMMSYGSYLKETGYALKKLGIEWLDLSQAGQRVS